MNNIINAYMPRVEIIDTWSDLFSSYEYMITSSAGSESSS